MAVQAQMYPDNLGVPLQSQDWLLMSNNNNNYDHSNNMLFNGCGINEMNLQNLQQKLQQQQQKQVQYQQQQQYLMYLQNMQQANSSANNGYVLMPSSKRQNLGKPTTANTARTASTTTSGSENMSISISQSLSALLEKQGQEMDRYVTLQNERLRLALQEQGKQQLSAVIRKLEEKTLRLIKRKDYEIVEATKRTMELQEITRKMEVENQVWQKVASENEQMVVNLNNTLEQIQQQQVCNLENSACSSNCIDDTESFCNVSDNKRKRDDVAGVAETRENRGETARGLCKVCKTREACILLLPCRHMCCCKACEAILDACPVCASAKMSSIEALFS